ncbi:PREDICTED: E3 ubiquitin protein ligase DRIP2 isoform X2 [Theobroma cacao]|uniref:E3 ubiquitin protein ligase DRIP2 isoform X2 n=2 Tax=Theobroma cacao TaxID=3641 RepID=A0AB32V650_THECC|nr:PREDICTED: E3 ubiquitin protein ligase DRIP2 isoform X2 [Theobroma cacao]EOY11048.1 DREB2A-interacting protein 2 isoform 1 [Theobroma cacao]
MAGGHHHVVKVKRETLESCMTCPLCNKLLREATTISLCLHTFCRKCIYEKLSDEGMDCCPVCDIELGCLPVDKLRPDHNLQDIRAKVFPFKRRKIRAPEVMPSTSPPAKRKERSLSSLVVSTPKVPMQTGLTGRRTKATARKRVAAFRGCNFSVEESLKKEDFAEDHPSGTSSPDSSNKISQSKRQDSSMAEPSSERRSNEDTDDVEMLEGKADLWTPLNCLVEAANRKSSKLNSQGLATSKAEPHNAPDCHLYIPETKADLESATVPDGKLCIPKAKSKEHGQNTKVQDEKNGASLISRPVKRRRLRAAAQKRAAASQQAASARVMLDTLGAKCNRKESPIWFSLVASEDQKGDASLPQISACYLRIKDGKMPVSFIQKYLVKKLDLASEAEVEIMCRAQPVLPTLQLHNLVDLWFRTASTAKKVPASVGSSAKDFVMVLSYRRKVQAP